MVLWFSAAYEAPFTSRLASELVGHLGDTPTGARAKLVLKAARFSNLAIECNG